MNITNEIIDRAVKVGRAWNKASVQERVPLNKEFDSLLAGLSDAQCAQLGKIVAGKI